MDPVHVASHFLNSHSTKGSKILLVLGVDHPNCSVAYSMVVTRVNSLYNLSSDTTSTTKEDKMIDVHGHHDIKIIVKH